MQENELIKQLNNLKSIKPDHQWKNDNRDILFNQISRGDSEQKISSFKVFQNIFSQRFISQVSQPAWAVVLIVLIIFSGGIASLNASKNTKPGDSLYIAKMIKEKARAVVAFNEKEKAKLSIEFAGNRAKEITQVLAEIDDTEKQVNEKVEKLSRSFKKSLETAKSRLVKINVLDNKEDNKEAENEAVDDNMEVFSASLGDKGDRIEISEPEEELADDIDAKQADAETASSAAENVLPVVAEQSNELEQALNEAEKLFNEQNYDGAADKLVEVNDIINNEEAVDETGIEGVDEVEDEGVVEEAVEDEVE